MPLLTSPFLAVMMAGGIYPALRAIRGGLGISPETCVCIGSEVIGVVPGTPGRDQALQAVTLPTLSAGTVPSCEVRYQGTLFGVAARPQLDVAHYLSAGAVSFARGVNDTPKIAALLLVGNLVAPNIAIAVFAVTMAVGGLVSARRVAATMSYRVTEMNPGEGFTANLITAVLVIGASRFGLPVSTTHVSCGSLFGIGAVTGQAHWTTISIIVMAWLITLPFSALLAALSVTMLRSLGA